MDLMERIRVISDYPKPGISFKDITTLLREGQAFGQAIRQLAEPFVHSDVSVVVGPEARGFLIGAPVALALQAGFVPVRKPGKLPAETIRENYTLEYGQDTLEMHKDAIVPGEKVLIADDLLATGGTILTTAKLIQQLGGEVVGMAFLIELTDLDGRCKIEHLGVPIHSLIQY